MAAQRHPRRRPFDPFRPQTGGRAEPQRRRRLGRWALTVPRRAHCPCSPAPERALTWGRNSPQSRERSSRGVRAAVGRCSRRPGGRPRMIVEKTTRQVADVAGRGPAGRASGSSAALAPRRTRRASTCEVPLSCAAGGASPAVTTVRSVPTATQPCRRSASRAIRDERRRSARPAEASSSRARGQLGAGALPRSNGDRRMTREPIRRPAHRVVGHHGRPGRRAQDQPLRSARTISTLNRTRRPTIAPMTSTLVPQRSRPTPGRRRRSRRATRPRTPRRSQSLEQPVGLDAHVDLRTPGGEGGESSARRGRTVLMGHGIGGRDLRTLL